MTWASENDKELCANTQKQHYFIPNKIYILNILKQNTPQQMLNRKRNWSAYSLVVPVIL